MNGCSCEAGTVNGRCAFCGERRTPRRQARQPAELGAVTERAGNTVERLNNAIVKLDWAAMGAPVSVSVKAAIRQLTEHWLRFYRDGSYWTLPDPVWFAKLGRYVEWYTRGYYLLPAASRVSVPKPTNIDPQFLELVNDTFGRVVAANVDTATAAAGLARDTADRAMGLGLLWLAISAVALVKLMSINSRAARSDAAEESAA